MGYWHINSEVEFEFAAVWQHIREIHDTVDWNRVISHKHNAKIMSFCIYKITMQRLPMNDRLSRWGFQLDKLCPLCLKEEETHQHLFFACKYSRSVASHFWQKMGLSNWFQRIFLRLLDIVNYLFPLKTLAYCFAFVLAVTIIYHLWSERSRRIFDQKKFL